MRSDFSAFCMRFDVMPVKQFLRRKGFVGRRFLAAAMLTGKIFSLNAPRFYTYFIRIVKKTAPSRIIIKISCGFKVDFNAFTSYN